MANENKIGLGLGSNLGDRIENVRLAVELLKYNAINKVSLSSFYETEPLGFESKNRFINAVMIGETPLSESEILRVIQNIEHQMGRKRDTIGYADRIIDIDFLFSDEAVMVEPSLVLPHPQMHERIFVLEPLAEIYPKWKHPLLGLSTIELLNNLKKNGHRM